jgi:hypothetical protein
MVRATVGYNCPPVVDHTRQQAKALNARAHLLQRATARTTLHSRITPGIESWIAAGAGVRGLQYQYQVRNDAVHIVLYIDRGQGSEAENKRIFDALHAQQSAIEQAFGAPLEWARGDTCRSSQIRYTVTTGGLQNRNQWPQLHDEAIDAMIRLERALHDPIQRLAS